LRNLQLCASIRILPKFDEIDPLSVCHLSLVFSPANFTDVDEPFITEMLHSFMLRSSVEKTIIENE